jgi:hypothetical protein
MVESIFQTLLLMAYFDIALLAITIANYAVSASYSGRESRLSRWRMERRKQKLRVRLKELDIGKAEIKSIRKEIDEAESDEKELSKTIFILSWQGAVVLPSLCFIASLICAIVGMNSEIVWSGVNQENLVQLMGVSAFLLGMGFIVLLNVIRTIDSVAKHLPIPEFEVFFEFPEHTLLKTLVMKRNERKTGRLMCQNKGEDIAEDVEFYVVVPKTFEVEGGGVGEVAQLGTESSFPDCISVGYKRDIVHVNMKYSFPLTLRAPDAAKTYDILVRINERKIGISDCKLTIEVVN